MNATIRFDISEADRRLLEQAWNLAERDEAARAQLSPWLAETVEPALVVRELGREIETGVFQATAELVDAFRERVEDLLAGGVEGICRVCGCTDEDCSECIERTGQPCHWVDEAHTLCSACAEADAVRCRLADQCARANRCSFAAAHPDHRREPFRCEDFRLRIKGGVVVWDEPVVQEQEEAQG